MKRNGKSNPRDGQSVMGRGRECETSPPTPRFPKKASHYLFSPHMPHVAFFLYVYITARVTYGRRVGCGIWGGRLMSVRVSENQNETSEKKRRPV